MKIILWNKISNQEKCDLLKRNTVQDQSLTEKTLKIINEIKNQGDEALIRLTSQYDGWTGNLVVTEEEFEKAYYEIEQPLLEAIRFSIQRIKAYHLAQLPQNWQFDSQDGIICERQMRSIASVGLYVPAGTAPLISSVMMLAIPALIAGCEQRILCTPAQNGKICPAILVAAKECGIKTLFKIGGAQAIAAMACGTQLVPKVDKIFGPGNQWVTKAKQLCAQNERISIDMPAGPSELLIIADETADPNFVAADLLSQAEHDELSQVILITANKKFANQTLSALNQQLFKLTRSKIINKALKNSKVILVEDVLTAFEISNNYAPEHLSIQLINPEQYKSKVKNAGTVFLGNWTAEALGDYNTGANHVLPTNGFSRTLNGLSILDFMKWIGFQTVSQEGILKIGPKALTLSKVEQLTAHANAIELRLLEAKKCSNLFDRN